MSEDKTYADSHQMVNMKVQSNFADNTDAIEQYRVKHKRTQIDKAVHLAKFPHLSEMGERFES